MINISAFLQATQVLAQQRDHLDQDEENPYPRPLPKPSEQNMEEVLIQLRLESALPSWTLSDHKQRARLRLVADRLATLIDPRSCSGGEMA